MKRSPAPARTWLLGVAVLILFRLLGEIVPLVDPQAWLWITRLGEAWTVGGLMVLMLGEFPLGDIRAGIGRGRMAVVGALIALVFAGQYLTVDTSAYPFVRWDMYTARADTTTFGIVQMTLPDGATQHLPLRDEAWLSTEPRAISGRLLALAERADDGDSQAREMLEETLQTLAGGVTPRPVSVHVLRCSVDKPTRSTEASCESVADVTVTP